MKIYVITRGTYSDYHIVTIFTDKHKAELYLKYYNYCNLEEYDTADDNFNIKDGEGYYVAVLHISIMKSAVDGKYVAVNRGLDINLISNEEYNNYINLKNVGRVEDESYLKQFNYPNQVNTGNEIGLHLVRHYSEMKYTELEVEKKILKVGYDIFSEIYYYLEEGYEINKISDMLLTTISE